MTGLSPSTTYARSEESTLATEIPLGPLRVVWVESGIQNWIAVQDSAGNGYYHFPLQSLSKKLHHDGNTSLPVGLA